jgi:predicted transglutaminase-like cysteine proteinase
MRFGTLVFVLGIACVMSQGGQARDILADPTAVVLPSSKRMSPYGRAEAPIGYLDFCDNNPVECLPEGPVLERVLLTPERWKELGSVNREINDAIKPMSDAVLYGVIERWTYPNPAIRLGDCEDYVLLKRRKLMEYGWPQSALLITVVRDENGEGHAILTVRTSRGDYILDNKHSRILSWQRTPYMYIKRQSGKDPRQWVSLVPLEPGPTAASAGVDWKD